MILNDTKKHGAITMSAYARLVLTAMTLLFALLIAAITAPAFQASPTFRGAERGTYLVQDEEDVGGPSLCYSESKAVQSLIEHDPGVIIYIYVATSDASRALVAYFSNGSAAFMVLEANGLVCTSIPMSPLQALIVKERAEADGSGIVIIPRHPQQEE